MAYEVSSLISVSGNTIRAGHPVVPSNLVTFLTASVTAGSTSLTVLDNNPLVQNDYVIVGKLGIDKTEIVQITGAVTQGTALTVGALVYDHPVDTPIIKILWNQVEYSGAATATGTKTLLTGGALVSGLQNIMPDRSDTVFTNTGTTYAFYFVRFKNTQTSTFSSYSASAPSGGYATSAVRSVKDEALAMCNEKLDGVLFTDSFLNNEIYNCEQEVWSERKQWSWAYTFDKILGQTVEGGLSFTLPSDISDNQSNKSILENGVRLGTRSELLYITKEEWDKYFQLVSHTTLASAVTVGDTTISLTSVSDFATSGTVVIGSDSAIAYTGVTVSTNTLTGVTGIAANHANGLDVWQNPAFVEPAYYTIFNNTLYFQTGVQSTYAGLNVYISYYRKPTTIVDDNSTLNIPDWSIYHYYLAWKILIRKYNGKTTDDTELFRKLYEERKSNLKRIDRTGQRVFMRPRGAIYGYPSTYIRTTFIQTDN